MQIHCAGSEHKCGNSTLSFDIHVDCFSIWERENGFQKQTDTERTSGAKAMLFVCVPVIGYSQISWILSRRSGDMLHYCCIRHTHARKSISRAQNTTERTYLYPFFAPRVTTSNIQCIICRFLIVKAIIGHLSFHMQFMVRACRVIIQL